MNRIKDSLISIINQSYKIDLELVIVDNGSEDGTSDYCQLILNSAQVQFPWKIVNEKTPGLVNARKAGLKSSKYEWVLFCDDDNDLDIEFIALLHSILLQIPNDVGVIGSIGEACFEKEKPLWFDKYSSSFAVGPQKGMDPSADKLKFVYGACSVYRKTILFDLFNRGFQPLLIGRKGEETISGDDVEWCYLMQIAGLKILVDSRLKFIHRIPNARLQWDYYLRLKRGITLSAALLLSYSYFQKHPDASIRSFSLKFFRNHMKSRLLVWKYILLWKYRELNQEQELAFTILNARLESFQKYRKLSISHFEQLKNYFGT